MMQGRLKTKTVQQQKFHFAATALQFSTPNPLIFRKVPSLELSL
jgi:hypothetical protein